MVMLQVTLIFLCLLLTGCPIYLYDNTTCFATTDPIVYVGGSGPGNYSSIQEAIDNVTNGSIIVVYPGVYRGSLRIYKSLSLISVEGGMAIIDGCGGEYAVRILAPRVWLTGFIIQNSSGTGVLIKSFSSNISYNTIGLNHIGLEVSSSDGNILYRNTISNNVDGLHVSGSSTGNLVYENTMSDNSCYGVYVESSGNSFYRNNFLVNGQHAHDSAVNKWDDGWYGNYWDDYKERYPSARRIWLKGIWSIPYEIPGGGNLDHCPLIKPYSMMERIVGGVLL